MYLKIFFLKHIKSYLTYSLVFILIFGLSSGIILSIIPLSLYNFKYIKYNYISSYNLSNTFSDISQLKSYSPISINVTKIDNLNFSDLYLPILLYHHIRTYTNNNDIIGEGLSVSPENFDSQIFQLISEGYHTIEYNDLINYIYFSNPLPKNPIMINFDDGYKDIYTNAFKTIKKYNIKVSCAIITGMVGNTDYMDWNQIKKLKSFGAEITSHSVNHPDLSLISKQQIIYELTQSKNTLDSILHQDTKVFVYPSGKYNQDVKSLVENSDYLFARSTNISTTISPANLLELPVIRTYNKPFVAGL